MKKKFKLIALMLIVASCESKADVKSDIDSLITERTNLNTEVNILSASLERKIIETERN